MKIVNFKIEEVDNLYRYDIDYDNNENIGSAYCFQSFTEALYDALKWIKIYERM
jgi:hypothetical protein